MGVSWRGYLVFFLLNTVVAALCFFIGAGWAAALFGVAAGLNLLTWLLDWFTYWMEGDDEQESIKLSGRHVSGMGRNEHRKGA